MSLYGPTFHVTPKMLLLSFMYYIIYIPIVVMFKSTLQRKLLSESFTRVLCKCISFLSSTNLWKTILNFLWKKSIKFLWKVIPIIINELAT